MNDRAEMTTQEIVDELRSYPSCGVGGPLHIVTDDANVEDHDLDFCAREIDTHWSIDDAASGDREQIQELAREILERLRPLSERERLVALGFPADYND